MSVSRPAAPESSVTTVASVGQVTLTVETWGSPDAEPVVLLHGGAQTRRAWRGTARRLSDAGWRVVCPDLRGHGDSSWSPGGDYSVDALRADLRRVLDHVGRPAHLVGASLGGLVAILGAAAYPGQVRSVTLVDVATANNRDGEERISRFLRSNIRGFASLGEVAKAVADYQRHRRRRENPAGLLPYVRTCPDGRLRWHWDPEFLQKDGLPWTRRRRAALARAARRVDVPVLLVVGGASDVVDEYAVVALRRQVPHVQLRTVPGAHHMIAGDDNAAFCTEIESFLIRVPRQ